MKTVLTKGGITLAWLGSLCYWSFHCEYQSCSA